MMTLYSSTLFTGLPFFAYDSSSAEVQIMSYDSPAMSSEARRPPLTRSTTTGQINGKILDLGTVKKFPLNPRFP